MNALVCSQEFKAKTGLTAERRFGLRLASENPLYLAKRAAEAENLAKSEFLSTLCHEIRNPVNVMVGMMDLALQTKLTPEQHEYLTLMKISSGSVLSVINNTLDIEKIEAGFVDLELISFSLRGCVSETVKMLSFEAQRKGLRLNFNVAAEVPDALRGDPVRLRQILLNLISNAIKFTERGEVLVHVTCHGMSAGEITCQFAIIDTGPGIPLERQSAIFSPFVQADATVARQYGGSGLGLTISARLVKLMSGKIWLESVPGSGSTFSFTACFGLQDECTELRHSMPACGTVYPSSSDQLPEKVGARPAASLRILVVDDEPLNRRLAQLVLENEGCSVALAISAEAALDVLRHERFDVVLMDLKMPGMDGTQATQEIRRREKAGGEHLLIFALTASETAHDHHYCLQAGMDGCLKKPVEPGSLFAMIRQLQVRPMLEETPLVLNERALMSSLNGEEKLLGEIVDLFIVHSDKLMQHAREALAAEDSRQFEHIMHTMTGMFRSLFAHAAGDLAGNLQAIVALDQRGETFRQLEHEVGMLKAMLIRLKRKACIHPLNVKGRAQAPKLMKHRKRPGALRSVGVYRHA